MKELFKTKTFYVGALIILGGIVDLAFGDTAGCFDRLLAGLALITGRDALRKIQK